MVKIVIYGAGGHGIVVAEILWQMNKCHLGFGPVGFIDDDPILKGKSYLGIDVLGTNIEDITIKYNGLIVAIGNNIKRKRIFDRFKKEEIKFYTAVHPSSVIARGVNIGEGAMICAGVIINPAAKIGSNVILNTGCTIDHHNDIEDHVHIAPGVNLGGQVQIGEGVLVGIGASVLPGCRIGSKSIVGAGSVVTCDVPDETVWAGVPAKPINTTRRN
jgi:sugar O-acyltransferase (sialic acid O-acetyltransferase NeuD family)